MSAPVSVVEAAPGLALIRIDRPERRNALDLDTWLALERCIVKLEQEDAFRVAILCGGGGVFSAGGDVRAPIRMGTGVAAPAGRLRHSHRVLQRLRACSKPVIAAVEGYALGMGFSIALACDAVVAGSSSRFAAPHAQRGLVPDGGIVWSLVRALGKAGATRVLLLGGSLTAEEARAAGLVYDVVDDGTAERAAAELARELLDGPSDVIELTRRLIRGADESTYEAFLREEFVAVALNMYGADAAEGLDAFAARRAPDFGGAREG